LVSVSARWAIPSAAARAARSATSAVLPNSVKWEWTCRWVNRIVDFMETVPVKGSK
jgi:hypothetical protein